MIRADYGTDNGPPCACEGTVYAYQIDSDLESTGGYDVTAHCFGCGCQFRFHLCTTGSPPSAKGIRQVHLNHVHFRRDHPTTTCGKE